MELLICYIHSEMPIKENIKHFLKELSKWDLFWQVDGWIQLNSWLQNLTAHDSGIGGYT